MATINASQDYDFINTLTFASASGTCEINLYRDSFFPFSGTVYYRTGTSGSWTTLSVSGNSTTFPVGSTTMQVANDWNKSGNNHVTQSFSGQASNLIEIAISQKAAVSGNLGEYFLAYYARECSSLTSLDIPDVLLATSVGSNFMAVYARDCSSLTALLVPDTSNITTVGSGFMFGYADTCTSLTSLSIPKTANLTSVGSSFMRNYADACTSLERLELPEAGWFAGNNVDWNVPSGRLNTLKGYVKKSTDLSNWQDLVVSGKTLYTNYVRDTDDVILESSFNPAFAHRRLLL